MSGLVRFRVSLLMGISSVALVAGSTGLMAQTALPGITVTAPSPIAKAPRPRPAQAAPVVSAPQAQTGEELAEDVVSLPQSLIVDDQSFFPVTVITEREITATEGQTLTEPLQTKPGMSGTNYAPGANRPIIRGLDAYRVRIQENGIGSHDVSAISEDHAVPIDPYAADRMEVIRGPAILRYGSQAIGGVVAVENNRIPTYVPLRGYEAEVRGGFNSVDDGRDGAFKVTAGAAGIVVHADGFKRHADDYRTPHGTQENSFVDSEGFSVGTSYVWADGFVGVSFGRFNSRYGIPSGHHEEYEHEEGEDEHEDDEHHHSHDGVAIDLQQDRIQSKGEWRVRSSGIEAIRYWFGASDYAHDEIIIDENEVGSRFTNKELEGRFEIQHVPVITPLGALRGAIGAQFGHRRVEAVSFEGDGLLEPARTRSAAAFWFEELQATRDLRFQAAVRIEQTKVDGTGVAFDETLPEGDAQPVFSGERSFVPVSGSLGLLYDLPMGVVARLTGQYVERAPDAAELFSKGLHEATGTFEIGNPFLDKEKAATAEIGFKRAKGRFRFDTSAYYTKFNGFIFKDKHGHCGSTIASCEAHAHEDDEHEEDEHGFDLVRFEQRDATFHGAEIAAEYDVAPIWNGVWGIDGQYDFVRARFKGDNVPRIPPHRLGGGIYYRDANWFARVGVLHAFKQDKVNIETDELETPGYTLVSAELAYTVRSTGLSAGIRELTIGLKGENLADDEVLNHASFKRSEDILLPGANIRLFGSVKFN